MSVSECVSVCVCVCVCVNRQVEGAALSAEQDDVVTQVLVLLNIFGYTCGETNSVDLRLIFHPLLLNSLNNVHPSLTQIKIRPNPRFTVKYVCFTFVTLTRLQQDE